MIGNDWDIVLESEFKKEYFYNLLKFVQGEYARKVVFPPKKEVFKAFRYTPYKNVKVVILGQDPYHGEGEAEGLSFSVKEGIKKPPSLHNMWQQGLNWINIDIKCFWLVDKKFEKKLMFDLIFLKLYVIIWKSFIFKFISIIKKSLNFQ